MLHNVIVEARKHKNYLMKNFIHVVAIMVFSGIVFASCKTSENSLKYSQSTKKEAKELRPKSQQLAIDALFIDANREKMLGNVSNALDLFSQVIQRDPQNDAAYYEMARLFNIVGKSTEAILYGEKACTLSPDNSWYLFLMADIYRNSRQYSKATEVLEKLAAKNTDDLDLQENLANSYLQENKLEKAIGVYNVIEKKMGVFEELSLQKQKIYLSLNQFDKAAAEVEKLSQNFPRETKYLAILAEMYMSKKDYPSALKYYRKIAEVNPNDSYIHVSLAGYYRQVGDKKKAFEELKLGFANPNLDIDTKVQILLTYYTVTEIYSDMKAEAFELAEVLTQTHPQNAKAWSILGDFLYRDKKLDEARKAFETVNQLDSSRFPVWEALLMILSYQNDTIAMMKESSKAIELFPEQPFPYMVKGTVLFQSNKLNEALVQFVKGQKLVTDNKELDIQFWIYLGDLYHKLNKYAEADNAFRKVLELDANNVYVLNNFAYYLSLRKENLDEAETMSVKLNELVKNNASYLDTWAWVLFQKKKYNEARTLIEKALELGGNTNDVIVEHYGDILYFLNERENAVTQWKKAKELGEGSGLLPKKIKDQKWYE